MSGEKGEIITVMACYNAEGNFHPPYCIFKGKWEKPEFEDGMPLVSHVEMNETSTYINLNVFMKFSKNHFIPRKVLLILDSHTSHCSDVAVLDLVAENEAIFFSLPNHFNQYLQSLDRSFYKPQKTYW
ncbi:HTH CENPB-type domain-containing protein [Trichonephila inaurata madagascariensis]|uniref:HTH CENPB-type domain-containing protein n=1 Tax=Trichonephila inaurata madagascariensis TaxID=2747483 RepID=A0A8X6ISS3_9ARAC|nr:HTH CENPB-type domain-containing protein [Trichonephila inaurata madagascariensis]